jgi:hypothetical protein
MKALARENFVQLKKLFACLTSGLTRITIVVAFCLMWSAREREKQKWQRKGERRRKTEN